MCVCACECLYVWGFFFYFFKSNLSVLESKECRLKNQRACRQANTLKTSRAQRQPNYAKPGGWFISARLQSLRVLLSLLFGCVLCCKRQAWAEENYSRSSFGTTERGIKGCWLKEPFAHFFCVSDLSVWVLSGSWEDQVAFEITGGADHKKKTLASCSTLYREDHQCSPQCNLRPYEWHLSANRAG